MFKKPLMLLRIASKSSFRTKGSVKLGKSNSVEDLDRKVISQNSLSSDQNPCYSKQVKPKKNWKLVEDEGAIHCRTATNNLFCRLQITPIKMKIPSIKMPICWSKYMIKLKHILDSVCKVTELVLLEHF